MSQPDVFARCFSLVDLITCKNTKHEDKRMDENFYGPYGTVGPASDDNPACTPLLNGTHLSDGRIPFVLGMGTAILVVSSV